MLETIKGIFSGLSEHLTALDPMKFGIVFFGVIFLGLIIYEHVSGKLDWTDLITGKGTTKVSLTKLLQLIGGMTATWVVMYQTMHASLATELFFAYLLYVASIEGYSKFMAARYGVSDAPMDTKKVETVTIINTPSQAAPPRQPEQPD